MRIIEFSQVNSVNRESGLYEILLKSGTLLKIGIGKDLRSRLNKHAKSYQKSLKVANGELRNVVTPEEVVSKSSILAKHLFFDSEIAPEYDLRTQSGRRQFLSDKCEIRLQYCDMDQAKVLERQMESTGNYRYCRRVMVRNGRN